MKIIDLNQFRSTNEFLSLPRTEARIRLACRLVILPEGLTGIACLGQGWSRFKAKGLLFQDGTLGGLKGSFLDSSFLTFVENPCQVHWERQWNQSLYLGLGIWYLS